MAKKKIVAKTVLFVEGTSDKTNRDLRRGLQLLLEQKIIKNRPRIIMGGPKAETIKKFLKSKFDAKTFLLVDLDGPETSVATQLEENSQLYEKKEDVFFMIQEMEAWFISQPNTLSIYYKDDAIIGRISSRPPKEIPDPKGELVRVTKISQNNKKGVYHEVKHGSDLLALLNLQKLRNDFDEVDKLIGALE